MTRNGMIGRAGSRWYRSCLAGSRSRHSKCTTRRRRTKQPPPSRPSRRGTRPRSTLPFAAARSSTSVRVTFGFRMRRESSPTPPPAPSAPERERRENESTRGNEERREKRQARARARARARANARPIPAAAPPPPRSTRAPMRRGVCALETSPRDSLGGAVVDRDDDGTTSAAPRDAMAMEQRPAAQNDRERKRARASVVACGAAAPGRRPAPRRHDARLGGTHARAHGRSVGRSVSRDVATRRRRDGATSRRRDVATTRLSLERSLLSRLRAHFTRARAWAGARRTVVSHNASEPPIASSSHTDGRRSGFTGLGMMTRNHACRRFEPRFRAESRDATPARARSRDGAASASAASTASLGSRYAL